MTCLSSYFLSPVTQCCCLSAGSAIVLNPYQPGNPNQQWERENPFIRSRATPNKVLDIASQYCSIVA